MENDKIVQLAMYENNLMFFFWGGGGGRDGRGGAGVAVATAWVQRRCSSAACPNASAGLRHQRLVSRHGPAARHPQRETSDRS